MLPLSDKPIFDLPEGSTTRHELKVAISCSGVIGRDLSDVRADSPVEVIAELVPCGCCKFGARLVQAVMQAYL